MKAEDVKVCVIRIEGTNCEDEMANAFEMVGAKAEKVHLKQLLGQCAPELKRNLEEYDALAFPGGFSAGDYVRAGAIFAARIKAGIGKDVRDFVEAGKPVLGVCNGFQILVELGLLPALDGTMSDRPTAALYTNDSGRFECRPSVLRNDNRGKCVFTSDIPKGSLMVCPSAHAEGKLLSEIPGFVQKLEENDQVVFRYVTPDGGRASYPWNPNGSPSDIAGICNPAGNVLGMMPHPERVMTGYTVPDWTRSKAGEDGPGKAIFTSVMKYLSKR
ncbi:phosphoribosylformylglycinamidine synthase I [Thermoplasmatales archaeon BRNA1]|nr:phosphoribosylformylglycinamidine synthase I [Thermoplasmatales archaeon BRNA1]